MYSRIDHRAHIYFHAERLSDSLFIERVWCSHSERGGPFLAVASTHWEFVVSRVAGEVFCTLHGPETKPREVYCPADGEWFAIRFKAGTFIPGLAVSRLVDGNDIQLATASSKRVRLDGSAFEIPDFDNAEAFVQRLARRGLLVRDATVTAVLAGDEDALSTRTVQRRFRQATGMSHTALKQIDRARRATLLLREGMSPADAAVEAGYFDQAHLTRNLRRLIGLTPGGITRGERQLSYLYKTVDSSSA